LPPKAHRHLEAAFAELRVSKPHQAADNQERASHHLKAMGWQVAALAVEAMSTDEWVAWTENRESPPWLSTFIQI